MYTQFQCSRAAVFDNHKLKLTMDEVQKRTGAPCVLGGWVFDNDPQSPTYLQPYNWLRTAGETVSRDGFREWRFTAGETGAPVLATETTAPEVLSGVPILKDGARVYRQLTPDVARSAARQAVGWLADGEILLWADKQAMSREELQTALLNLGVRDALMLDGGGSVQARGPGLHVRSSRTLATMLLFWPAESPKSRFLVCLDAGHDAGNLVNKSPDGSFFEHEFALDMGKRIRTLLEQAGVEVLETRPDGGVVSLERRCQIANEAKADLFVSLHSNAAGSGWSSAAGAEVYCYHKGGQAEQCARAVAEQMAAEGVALRKYPVLEKNLYVLRRTVMPAILVEHGFHTNRVDVALLKDGTYRQKLARADAGGILRYLGVPEPEDEAARAVRWAVEQGILRGNAQGDLMLDQAPTRRQLCVMLYRALGEE